MAQTLPFNFFEGTISNIVLLIAIDRLAVAGCGHLNYKASKAKKRSMILIHNNSDKI